MARFLTRDSLASLPATPVLFAAGVGGRRRGPLPSRERLRRAAVVLAASVLAAVAIPLPGHAAPDEIQRQLLWRAHEAKRQQLAAEAETRRQASLHVRLMADARATLSADRPPQGADAALLSEWFDQHLRRLDEAFMRLIDQYPRAMPLAPE